MGIKGEVRRCSCGGMVHTIDFTAKVDDEFADYVLSGGCQQSPAQQVPG